MTLDFIKNPSRLILATRVGRWELLPFATKDAAIGSTASTRESVVVAGNVDEDAKDVKILDPDDGEWAWEELSF